MPRVNRLLHMQKAPTDPVRWLPPTAHHRSARFLNCSIPVHSTSQGAQKRPQAPAQEQIQALAAGENGFPANPGPECKIVSPWALSPGEPLEDQIFDVAFRENTFATAETIDVKTHPSAPPGNVEPYAGSRKMHHAVNGAPDGS